MQVHTKMKLVSCVGFFMLLWSCNTPPKEDCVRTQSEELRAYAEVLNDLVDKRFYSSYLHGVNESDSVFKGISKDEIIDLKEELIDNPERKCWLFMDTTMTAGFDPWAYILKSDKPSVKEIKDIVSSISQNGQDVIDQLNSMQVKYSPNDFETCYYSFKPLDSALLARPCTIGAIALSNISFNSTKDKGLLYYQFDCGEMCGHGELLLIEKKDNKWSIQDGLVMYLH